VLLCTLFSLSCFVFSFHSSDPIPLQLPDHLTLSKTTINSSFHAASRVLELTISSLSLQSRSLFYAIVLEVNSGEYEHEFGGVGGVATTEVTAARWAEVC
jgi:hypothetical protein